MTRSAATLALAAVFAGGFATPARADAGFAIGAAWYTAGTRVTIGYRVPATPRVSIAAVVPAVPPIGPVVHVHRYGPPGYALVPSPAPVVVVREPIVVVRRPWHPYRHRHHEGWHWHRHRHRCRH